MNWYWARREVRLSKKEMRPYEARLLRSKILPKYDITIKPLARGR